MVKKKKKRISPIKKISTLKNLISLVSSCNHGNDPVQGSQRQSAKRSTIDLEIFIVKIFSWLTKTKKNTKNTLQWIIITVSNNRAN